MTIRWATEFRTRWSDSSTPATTGSSKGTTTSPTAGSIWRCTDAPTRIRRDGRPGHPRRHPRVPQRPVERRTVGGCGEALRWRRLHRGLGARVGTPRAADDGHPECRTRVGYRSGRPGTGIRLTRPRCRDPGWRVHRYQGDALLLRVAGDHGAGTADRSRWRVEGRGRR